MTLPHGNRQLTGKKRGLAACRNEGLCCPLLMSFFHCFPFWCAQSSFIPYFWGSFSLLPFFPTCSPFSLISQDFCWKGCHINDTPLSRLPRSPSCSMTHVHNAGCWPAGLHMRETSWTFVSHRPNYWGRPRQDSSVSPKLTAETCPLGPVSPLVEAPWFVGVSNTQAAKLHGTTFNGSQAPMKWCCTLAESGDRGAKSHDG